MSEVSDAIAAIAANLAILGNKIDTQDQLATLRGDQVYIAPDADCEIPNKGLVLLAKSSANGTFTLPAPEADNDFGVLTIINKSFRTHTVSAAGLVYDGDSTPKDSIVLAPGGSIVLRGTGSTSDPAVDGFYNVVGTPFNAAIS